ASLPADTDVVEVFYIGTRQMRKINLPRDRMALNLAFAPDGRTLAAENADGTVTLFEVAGGTERNRLRNVEKPLPDQGKVEEVVVNLQREDHIAPPGSAKIAFTQDAQKLAIARGTEVGIWDVWTGEHLTQLQGHQGKILSLIFTGDGKRLATGSSDTTA